MACRDTTATPNGTAASKDSSIKEERAVLEAGTQYLPLAHLISKGCKDTSLWHVIAITALKPSQEHVLLTRKNRPVPEYNIILQEGPERHKEESNSNARAFMAPEKVVA